MADEAFTDSGGLSRGKRNFTTEHCDHGVLRSEQHLLGAQGEVKGNAHRLGSNVCYSKS